MMLISSVRVPPSAVAFKYSDPTEEARWIYSVAEARAIEREDAGLIVWVSKNETLDDYEVR